MIRSLVIIAATSGVASAEPAIWHAQPAPSPSTGAAVAAAVGNAEVDTKHALSLLWTVRAHLRVIDSLQVELGLTGEIADDFRMAGPLLAATWTRPVGTLQLVVRGAFAFA